MERISTITSFCANLTDVNDSSHLTNIRYYSDRATLYKQWAQYRLAKMRQRIESLEASLAKSPTCDVSEIHRFAQSQIGYLKRTARQLIPLDEYDWVVSEFGTRSIRNARKLWAKAEMLEGFAQHVESVTPGCWRPESPLWADLAETQMAIKAGQVLESQTGRFKWTKERPFCMGDELLRQGLPEVFLLWLDATGLYAAVSS